MIASDEHPNVVRYYAQEQDDNFIYIALERCVGSLQDLVEPNAQVTYGLSNVDVHGPPQDLTEKTVEGIARGRTEERWRSSALRHMITGLQHLHQLKIVHRDLKPANILYTSGRSRQANKGRSGAKTEEEQKGEEGMEDMVGKIADMGLGKKLDLHRSSFDSLVTGSVGWQPPELLQSQPHHSEREHKRRLTKAVDIFSAGCIIYYVLTHGQHPFGTALERELNITRGRYDLSSLSSLPEAQELVKAMIAHRPDDRLSADEAVSHVYFWPPQKRLNFLMDVSDCVESLPTEHPIRQALELNAEEVGEGCMLCQC